MIRRKNPLSSQQFAEIRNLLSSIPTTFTRDSMMDFLNLQTIILANADELNELERGYIQAHFESIGISYSDMIEGRYNEMQRVFTGGFDRPFDSTIDEGYYSEAGAMLRENSPLNAFEESFIRYFLSSGNTTLEDMQNEFVPSFFESSLIATIEKNRIPLAAANFLRYLDRNHGIMYFHTSQREVMEIPEIAGMMENIEDAYSRFRPESFPQTWVEKVAAQSSFELREDAGFTDFTWNAYDDYVEQPQPVDFNTVGLYFYRVPYLDIDYSFDYADFSAVDFRDDIFHAENVSLQNAIFGEVVNSDFNLMGADLRNTDLSKVRRSIIDIEYADLRGATMPKRGVGNTFYLTEETRLPPKFSTRSGRRDTFIRE